MNRRGRDLVTHDDDKTQGDADGSDRPLIFLSHLSADGDLTRLLQSDLDSRFLGALRFFNTSNRSIHPGQQWFSVILDQLTRCDVLLAIMSPGGLRSPWVNFEAGAAWLRGAAVIPCCVGQIRKESLPPPYNTLQAVDLDDPIDLRQVIETIGERANLRGPTSGLDELANKLRAAVQVQSSEPNVDLTNLGNRLHRFAEREWRYRRAEHNQRRWAATYTYKSSMEVLDPTLESILFEFAPTVEAVPFSLERQPKTELISFRRESTGTVRMASPHRQTGSAFAFRVHFEPPLRQGEDIDLTVRVDFPEYKVSSREELAAALLRTGAELVDYQFNKMTVTTRIEKFRYRVVIPKELGASPLVPQVTRYDSEFLDEEKYLREQPGAYEVSEIDYDGTECWVMEINRTNPPYRARYRIRWRLPNERDLPSRGE